MNGRTRVRPFTKSANNSNRGPTPASARAVSRLVTIASGLDPHGLGVPEVSWMRQPAASRYTAG
ncbi:hypothetical protein MAHJHV57_51870 [Mycobacterium avium subsp. hominissuis]